MWMLVLFLRYRVFDRALRVCVDLRGLSRTSRKAPAALHFLIGLFLCLITFPRRLALLCALVATLAVTWPLCARGLFGRVNGDS